MSFWRCGGNTYHLGAALIARLNRVQAVDKERPPILLINSEHSLESYPAQSRKLVRATLTSARPVIDSPTDIPIENTSTVDAAVPEPTPLSDFKDASCSTSISATSSATSSATTLGIACPNAALLQANIRYPAQAIRDGIEGGVTASFAGDASGEIKNIPIIKSSNRIFNNVVAQTVR